MVSLMDLASSPSNLRSDDRIIMVKPIAGKDSLDSKGLTDKRLWTGENKVHGIRDPYTGLWYIRYELGAPPPAVRDQNFTSFKSLLEYVKEYFSKRNIEVTEVID